VENKPVSSLVVFWAKHSTECSTF